MCLVIDTNTLSYVFNPANSNHEEFKPVLDWIKKGKGKIIFGGNNYLKELERAPRCLRIIRRFQEKRKALNVNKDNVVDWWEEKLKLKVNNQKFNDPHIMALIIVSKCKVLCTKDERSHKYLFDLSLYPSDVKPPKIYSQKANINLLVDEHIVKICK